MGWTSLLGAGNPLAQYAQQNQRTLGAIGAGLASGQNFSDGLSAAVQGIPAARTADDAYATAMAEKAKTEADTQRSMRFLQERAPKFFEAVQAGVMTPGAAWDEVMLASRPKTPESFTLGPGEARYQGDQLIAQGPEDTKAAFSNEGDLYKQYAGADSVKAYEAVKGGYERVRQSAQLDTGAGDMGLIYGYMKMLDPGSVVRESEFAMAAQAGDFGEQIQGLVSRVVNGERLPPTLRQDFTQAAEKLYTEASSNLADTNAQFSQRATGYGVDPNNVIRSPEAFDPLAPALPAAPQKTSTGVSWSR